MDVREALADQVDEWLLKVVRAALGEPGAVLGAWDAVALKGGTDPQSGARSLFLLKGTASVGSVKRPWRVVLKVLARGAGHADPAHVDHWEREALIYGSGLLDDLPPGLCAPRCFGVHRPADGVAWLWLEHVQDTASAWSPARWRSVAQILGRFNGAYLAGRPLPRVPWLGGRRLRTWLERHRPLVGRIAAAPDNPAVRGWWPRPTVDAILRLWEERDAFCLALERLPQTLCHGDAIRRNLLTRRGVDGAAEMVAIDWEYAGRYAAGEEVGQKLSIAAAFYDVEPADLRVLDDLLFSGYLDGLRDAGWQGDARAVRLAYAAHAALRNAFNAVGATVPADAQRTAALRTYGHTWEELAERRAEVRPFLLARAAEARRLLEAP